MTLCDLNVSQILFAEPHLEPPRMGSNSLKLPSLQLRTIFPNTTAGCRYTVLAMCGSNPSTTSCLPESYFLNEVRHRTPQAHEKLDRSLVHTTHHRLCSVLRQAVTLNKPSVGSPASISHSTAEACVRDPVAGSSQNPLSEPVVDIQTLNPALVIGYRLRPSTMAVAAMRRRRSALLDGGGQHRFPSPARRWRRKEERCCWRRRNDRTPLVAWPHAWL